MSYGALKIVQYKIRGRNAFHFHLSCTQADIHTQTLFLQNLCFSSAVCGL